MEGVRTRPQGIAEQASKQAQVVAQRGVTILRRRCRGHWQDWACCVHEDKVKTGWLAFRTAITLSSRHVISYNP